MDFKACSSNPKLEKIKEILLEVFGTNEDARCIIFVKTRRLADYLTKWIIETKELKGLNPRSFVGQAPSSEAGGTTKHAQKDILAFFKEGQHKLIMATSVAEEGLDITKCNLVIRYEHVTNEIARTQSRGRARAPGSKYYVITGQGSPIADKEQKNAEAEKLMHLCTIELEQHIERNRDEFEAQISEQQQLTKRTREIRAMEKVPFIMEGEFEFRCFNCNNYICMLSDIRKVKGGHHVCVADDANERMILHSSSRPQLEDSVVEMDKTPHCNNCERPLGQVFSYKGKEFPLINIEKVSLFDSNGKGSHYRKWSQVPCKIQEFKHEDLL